MSEAAVSRLGQRLSRILLLLPYAIRHPGVSVDELSRRFGIGKQDLLADLNLVFVCGLPGYGPGDLIDVVIEEERVWVRTADYFGAPLRLTPTEALALYAGGAAIAELPGMEEADALRRALGKLGRALGAGDDRGAPAGVDVALVGGPGEQLETLNRALESRRRVGLEYLSATRGELTRRTVDPWGLVAATGHWYLVGFDHSAQDERMFRTDRIKSAAVLDEGADVPDDFDPEVYRGAFSPRGEQPTVTFEISPQAARWFEDYPVVRAEGLSDGWRKITLVSGGDRWFAVLLLRLGKDARAVEPPEAKEKAVELAAAIAARYSND